MNTSTGTMLAPLNPKYSSQTSLMEHLKSLHVGLGRVPKLTSIKQYSLFVYPVFRWCSFVLTIPYTAKLVESTSETTVL